MSRAFLFLLFLVVSFNACSVVNFARYYAAADTTAGKLNGRIYETKDTSYQIGELSSDWKRIDIKGGDLAYWNESIKTTITVNSTCTKNNEKAKYSLRALSEQLLVGIADKELVSGKEIDLNGEKALVSVYSGKLQGVPVKLGMVVIKNGQCIYDFTSASSPQNFDAGFRDLDSFISDFKIIEMKKKK